MVPNHPPKLIFTMFHPLKYPRMRLFLTGMSTFAIFKGQEAKLAQVEKVVATRKSENAKNAWEDDDPSLVSP